MSEVVERLRERRAKVWEQAKRVADVAADENRAFSGEEEGQWQSLNAELDALDKRIKNVLDGEARAKETEDAYARLEGQPVVKADATRGQKDGVVDELRAMLAGTPGAPRSIEVKSDKPVNFRTLTKLTAGAGANTVQVSFFDELLQNMIETSAVLQAGVRVLNTSSGETIQIPKTTSHSTAAIVAEAAAIGVSDPAFGQASLGAYKYGVMVQLSRELVDDTTVDLQGYLAMETGRALGNAFGAHLIAGTGTGQPRGILTDTTLGVTSPTGVAGMPSADNLIDLYYSVIAPYRNSPSAAYLMKDTTLGALRKVKDTTGQYIFQPSLTAGTPDTLLAKPIYTDPYMPANAVNARSVVFGDFSRYFVRLAGGIRFERSDEYAFNADLITFRALMRGDGALMDTTGALKHAVGAAT
jgi:HK97 family phage major capsid protein